MKSTPVGTHGTAFERRWTARFLVLRGGAELVLKAKSDSAQARLARLVAR